MENMNNTMELLAGKVTEVETTLEYVYDWANKHGNCNNENFKTINDNFSAVGADICALLTKHKKLRNFVFVSGIAGGYLLYKQFKTYNERMAAMEKELDKFKMEKKEQVFEDK